MPLTGFHRATRAVFPSRVGFLPVGSDSALPQYTFSLAARYGRGGLCSSTQYRLYWPISICFFSFIFPASDLLRRGKLLPGMGPVTDMSDRIFATHSVVTGIVVGLQIAGVAGQ